MAESGLWEPSCVVAGTIQYRGREPQGATQYLRRSMTEL